MGQQKGFTVGNIDCRTTKCKADVAFSNRQVARQSVGSLLHENYEPNCATSIRLPNADGERGEVAAALQLEALGPIAIHLETDRRGRLGYRWSSNEHARD